MISQTKSDKSCVLSCFWHRRCIWQRHCRRVPLVARTLLKKFYPKCWPCGWPTSFVIWLTTTLLQVPGLHNNRKPISTGSRIGFGNATVYLTSCICIYPSCESRDEYNILKSGFNINKTQRWTLCRPILIQHSFFVTAFRPKLILECTYHISLCSHAIMQSCSHRDMLALSLLCLVKHSGMMALCWGCSLLRQDVHGSLCPYSH